MFVGSKGRALIHHFEGHTPFAYTDTLAEPDNCTAGPGVKQHDGACTRADFDRFGTKFAPKITPERYERMFLTALRPREQAVERLIGPKRMKTTKRHKFSAMVSLLYNIGEGNFATSSVLRHHKAGRDFRAGLSFMLWDKAGGKVLLGLSRRRRAERRLYRTGELRMG